jgi:hypothetical protein
MVSGISDTPYVIDAKNVDRYPLIQQFDISQIAPTPTVPEFPTLIILPFFEVATLLSSVLIRKRPKKK